MPRGCSRSPARSPTPSHMAPKIALAARARHRRRALSPAGQLPRRATDRRRGDRSGARVDDDAVRSARRHVVRGAARRVRDRPSADAPGDPPAHAIAGTLTRGRALDRPPAGTPVAVGTGDDFATPLGAGIVAPGPLVVTLGTAEVVGTLSDCAGVRSSPRTRASDRGARSPSRWSRPTRIRRGAFFVENPGWLSGGAVRWATRLLGLASDAELDRARRAARRRARMA